MQDRLHLLGGLVIGYGLVAGALWVQLTASELQPLLEPVMGGAATMSVLVLFVRRRLSWLPVPLFAIAIALAAGATGAATLGALVGLATLSIGWVLVRPGDEAGGK